MEVVAQKELVKTSYLICGYSCGMDVYLEGGQISKVEGMREHPLSKGFLCPRGEVALEYVYSPDCLKYPLKKEDSR